MKLTITDERAEEIHSRVSLSSHTGAWQIRAFRREGYCACIETVKPWGPAALNHTIAHLERNEDADLLLHAREDLRDLLDDRRKLLAEVEQLEAECRRLRRSIA